MPLVKQPDGTYKNEGTTTITDRTVISSSAPKPYRQIDTRDDSGKGLEYKEYDTTMEDWAKAPKTRLDGRFKIQKPKTYEKPGEVKYYGNEHKEAAEKLNQQRWDAYNRRQTNEYIRTGAAAPDEKIEMSKVSQGELRKAKQDYGSKQRGRAERGSALMEEVKNRVDEMKNTATASVQSMGVASGGTGNFKTAVKEARSFINSLKDGKGFK